MILLSDFERGPPFPPEAGANNVFDFSRMTTGAPALGAKAPVVCQAAAWVGHDIVAPGMLASPREGDDASHR
ncbi:hypothetical protein B5P46_08170 [Rhizobium leguminosarum]|uniref:Uncharacterized protein n=1 Tax=Rhizobium leguminosarum TaxID=384 RepID=A0A4Q1UDA9_RHILE|nr:hypothetical protein [Rhizobium leguminosarum]RXT28738.1 hypothetical protein B5P46_08170 [Rhizobium leguminosarum]